MSSQYGRENSPRPGLPGGLENQPDHENSSLGRLSDLQNDLQGLDQHESRKRKREVVAIFVLALLFVALTIAEFRLMRVSSTLPFVNSIFFFGLLNINLILLIAMVWLVARNIGKLFIERRRKILGARLKTKLVISFLAFSITPTLVLFVISALYINSSFDKWFSLKIQNTLQASLEITDTYYRNTKQSAMHFAEHLANGVGRHFRVAKVPGGAAPADKKWIGQYLQGQRELLALDAIEFYVAPLEERAIDQRFDSVVRLYPRLPLDLLEKAFTGEKVSVVQHISSGDLIRCLVPVHGSVDGRRKIVGVIAVNSYIPVSLINKVDEIASVFDDYKETNPLKYPMKTTYLVILIMITLVIIIVAIWIGLYMARELTVPVERLVKGAEEVGAGNLDVFVQARGHDEIAVLVDSFNKMTRDLRDNRARLIEAGADLEKRRLQLETVLGNISAGVISVHSSGEIATFNAAAGKLLQIAPEQALGQLFVKVFEGEANAFADLISRFLAIGGESSAPEAIQWNFRCGESTKVLSAIATPLRESEKSWGVVVVIDDVTHLIKGQREMAWREVARRIAHEIKNPLTPIKLSAQRLQRRLGDLGGKEGDLVGECTDTIIKHTDELKEMVNEFSNFARFPEISPAPNDLSKVLREVVKLYEQGHGDILFELSSDSRIPIFDFDRDQIKRVVINLFDNAVAALKSLPPVSGFSPVVSLSARYNEELQMVVIEVEDNGPGMSPDVLDRVFEPYFSTKSGGTGLGLAIAKRIVNDHDGFIRVSSEQGKGARFLIELPSSRHQGSERRWDRKG